MSSQRAIWRDDIDALQFEPAGHGGLCLIHRLAFRKLLGPGTAPDPATCLSLFESHHPAFTAAAITKIAAQTLPPGRNFHLNSRDVRRQMMISA